MRQKNQNPRPKGTNTRGSKPSRNGKPRNQGKMVEVNVPDKSLNMADVSDNRVHYQNMPKGNSPDFYDAFPELVNNAGNLFFSNMLGDRVKWFQNSEAVLANYATSVPGIMTLGWKPSVGVAQNSFDALNLADSELFSFIRKNKSGRMYYQSQDTGLYIISMDSVYSWFLTMSRVYGVINKGREFYNRYKPAALVTALGFDYADLRTNLANLEYYINEYARTIAGLAVPEGIRYVKRHNWLNSNIYLDSESVKAQMYCFKQETYYKFGYNTDTKAGQVVPIDLPNNQMTYDDIVEFGNSLIDPIYENEDFKIISSDILNVFGDNFYTISPMPKEYTVTPVYNKEVLAQIENAIIYEGVQVGDVTQVGLDNIEGNAYLQAQPYWMPNNPEGYVLEMLDQVNPLLNYHFNDPTPMDIVEASRFICNLAPFDEEKGYRITSCGTEIMSSASVFFVDYNQSGLELSVDAIQSFESFDSSSNTHIRGFLGEIWAMSVFDWHPMRYIFWSYIDGTSKTVEFFGVDADLDNYTNLEPTDIDKLNRVCVMSAFFVPGTVG